MTESTKSGSEKDTLQNSKQDTLKEQLKVEKQKCKVLKTALKDEKVKQEQCENDLKITMEKNCELQLKLTEKVSFNLCTLVRVWWVGGKILGDLPFKNRA